MILWCTAAAALATDLKFTFDTELDAGEKPEFAVTSPVPVAHLQVAVDAGGQTFKYDFDDVQPGLPYKFEWARDAAVTHADVRIFAEYADGNEEDLSVPIDYSYSGALSADISHATADVSRRVLVVPVSARVDSADVVVYGAHKMELDRRTVAIHGGPGPVEIPWIGDPSEAVLLDVTIHSGGAWARVTYSPWFLDIPHQDVLFETDRSAILPAEEGKLADTLNQLADVMDKYGPVVPVKLYIAGCTDTVGDSGHNLELSRARARAIAAWLRSHGFDQPIFYHGFGEGWLAVPTGDGVDNASNRRAVYMVGANPPPGESGAPATSWTPL